MPERDYAHEIALRISETHKISYSEVYEYLHTAVVAFNVKLPDPESIDYTLGTCVSQLVAFVEKEKNVDEGLFAVPSVTVPYVPFPFDMVIKDVDVNNFSAPTSPKEYGQNLHSWRRRSKHRK